MASAAVAALAAGGLILVTSVAGRVPVPRPTSIGNRKGYDRSVSTGSVPPHLTDGVMRPTHEIPRTVRWAMIGAVS